MTSREQFEAWYEKAYPYDNDEYGRNLAYPVWQARGELMETKFQLEEYQDRVDYLENKITALEARNKELVEALVYASVAMINISDQEDCKPLKDIVNSLREKENITGSDLSLLDVLCKALANQPTEGEVK